MDHDVIGENQSSFLRVGIEFTQRQNFNNWRESRRLFYFLTNQAGQALSAEQREQLQAHLYQVLGEQCEPIFSSFYHKARHNF